MAVAITQTANPAGAGSTANIVTHTAAAIGTASLDRIVVVAIGKEVVTVTPTAVTIGGVTAALINGNTFGSMGAWLYFAPVPTGTTADILVTWSGAVTNIQNHIAVYAITDAAGPPSSGSSTSTDMDATSPLTTGSTTIPASGGMLAVAVGAADTVTKTWANLTEDITADAGDFRFMTATSLTAGTATRTCTGGTNAEDGVLAWAIFSQTVLPPNSLLLMPTMVPPSRRV